MQTEFDKAQAQISTMIAVNHIPLPITNDMGDRWVVVALTDEPLNTLIQRVQRVGGYANVFIPTGDRVVQIGMVDSKCGLAFEIPQNLQGENSHPGVNARQAAARRQRPAS